MDVSKNGGFSPQIIHGLIGFSIIFTIHFGGNTPIFWKHPDGIPIVESEGFRIPIKPHKDSRGSDCS